jgi:hypothetical protein
MGSITLPERNLRERLNTLHELFAPLRNGRQRVACRFASGCPSGTAALVATDDTVGAGSYRGVSFRTSVKVLRCSYFELWRGPARGSYTLDRAYFTLVEVVRATHEYSDLLCIHTDPGDENNLKQGPHLHVSCAPDPIRHCHFPLEFGFLETVLTDCGSLSLAMQRAIEVIARDVLPRFKDRQ